MAKALEDQNYASEVVTSHSNLLNFSLPFLFFAPAMPAISVHNRHFGPIPQEKNNGFPFLDILGYLKNTHKNPKFGRVRQVPIRELGWEFPGWDLSHFAKFGIFMGIL